MNRRSFLPVVFILFVLTVRGQQDTGRPNILFIYTDDQAYWTTAYSGNKQAFTPHIDQLAKEGVSFSNAFVTTPVCSPARVSLITSQYASEYGITDFIADPGHKLYDPEKPAGLDNAVVTFADILAGAGYRTGLIGKWHLGDWTKDDARKYHPKNYGFQYFMGLTGGGTSADNALLEMEDGTVERADGLTDDVLTDHALRFIAEKQGQPFLLCLHFRSPHTPWMPVAPEDIKPYEKTTMEIPNPSYPDLDVEKVKRRMKEYLASVTGVDRNIGRVLQLLSELGIDTNTIIIFSSDHGYNMGHNGIEHKGNGHWITKTKHPATVNIAENSRPNLYDHSLRTPAIIRWPGFSGKGIVRTETISNLDWYPTIVEMAGASIPSNKIIRGRSIVPLLNGNAAKGWNNNWYAEYSMFQYSRADMRTYRTKEWKLVRDFLNPGRDELYHIATDPEEANNLIEVKKEKYRRVKRKLNKMIIFNMRKLNDPLLEKIKTN